ncbi:HAD-IC family P-type ATPase [Candidatus Uhrbacteria bacterium]|nr:HAD-IC family P-type ATPase [Candidatus Uhrbacteria bacterium]
MIPFASWHTEPFSAVLKAFETTTQGLADAEVLARQKSFGLNELPKEKSVFWWVIFGRQFLSPLMLILIVASILSGLLGDPIDAAVIFAAVVLNTVIGFVQEFKADRALTRLQSLVKPVALVRRAGRTVKVKARDLVPGDILLLHLGDQVSADARLIESVELQVNEAPLTGESLPVLKHVEPLGKTVALAERADMVFAGTSIVGGHGQAVVVATGLQTQIGNIANLIATTDETQTPLQQQLVHLAHWISFLVVGLVAILFVLGVVVGRDTLQMFEVAVALAVAAIPEGLAVSVTIILAIGMQRILKRRALVRKMIGAETLGSVSVICFDKTGTLTQGEMRVTFVLLPDQTVDAARVHEKSDGPIRELLEDLVLCNDAQRADGQDGKEISGSPTERALLAFVMESGVDVQKARDHAPRVSEISFDSSRKFHLTQHQYGDAFRTVMTGAPAKILAACDLSEHKRVSIEKQIEDFAKKGLRLVAVARRTDIKPFEHSSTKDLEGFDYLGLVVLQDPLRLNIQEEIAVALRAGIRPVMITGDHPETARWIAQQAGIEATSTSVLTGSQLDEWDDERLAKHITEIAVFARVEPRHKMRIVQAWQKHGEVVAMTGDGVNDAPALKAADIGIAMGSGTEVAKQASDLVLLDNNFATITSAVAEGRAMFDNIRKSSAYLLADSFTEIILIAGSLLLGLPTPLLPIQILWINLISDSLPNIGLTLEPAEKDVMTQPPRQRTEAVLNKEVTVMIFTIGIVTDLILFILYFLLLRSLGSITEVRTILFMAVGIDSLFYIFALRSFRRTIFSLNPFSNLWLVGGVLIGFALMLLPLVHPVLRDVFSLSVLRLSDWLVLLMMGLVKLIMIEAVKERYFSV